jgi:hypothetical protein
VSERRTGGVSRRVNHPPRDYPVAKGVAPPPGWFVPQPAANYPVARPAVAPPSPAPRTRAADAAGSPFTFAAEDIPTRPRPARRLSVGWLRQAIVVVSLAGTCMAAGWWLFQGRHARTTAAPTAVKAEPKPAEPVAVASAPKPTPPPAPPAKPKEVSPSAEQPAALAVSLTFQRDILPIFQAKCVNCHGGGNKRKGGLDVRSVATLLQGGDSGPSINRQNPEQSALWEAVANNQMPPGKTKLTEAEKTKLHGWLLGGAK